MNHNDNDEQNDDDENGEEQEEQQVKRVIRFWNERLNEWLLRNHHSFIYQIKLLMDDDDHESQKKSSSSSSIVNNISGPIMDLQVNGNGSALAIHTLFHVYFVQLNRCVDVTRLSDTVGRGLDVTRVLERRFMYVLLCVLCMVFGWLIVLCKEKILVA